MDVWLVFLRFFALFVAAGMLISACSNDDDANSTAIRKMPESQLSVLVDSAPEPQRKALDDGIVQFSELEAATLSTIRCLEEQDIIIISGPTTIGQSDVTFSYSGGPEDLTGMIARRAYDRCYSEFESAVRQVWGYQTAPDERQLEDARQVLIACLMERGVPATPGMSHAEIISLISSEHGEAMSECMGETQLETGFTGTD